MNTKLYEARIRNRWTIENVCERTGISEKTYRRWEKGTHQPHYSSLELLCAAFHMTAEELGFGQTPALALASQPIIVPASSRGVLTTNDDLFSTGIVALLLAQQINHWSAEELRVRVDHEMRQHDMGTNDVTRREALKLLSGLPLTFTTLSAFTNTLLPNESLLLFTAGIPACWKLYYTGGNLVDIQSTIQGYITQLEPLMSASGHRSTAAGLLSESYQLASMVSLENEDYRRAMTQSNLALNYAHSSSDPNIEAAAILRKATVLYYQKRYQQMGQVIQTAIGLASKVSPLLQARIYSEMATDTTSLSTQEALRYIGMALDSCPNDVELDPAFSYTYTSPYILHLNAEIAYTSMQQYDNALQALAQAEKYVPNGAISTRSIELTTHQARIAIATNDLDLSCEKMEEAMTASTVLQSDLWYSDVEQLYQQLQGRWQHETRVKLLGERLKAH